MAAAVAAVAIAVGQIALFDALDAGELLTIGKRDQRHALGRAAHLADLGNAGADQHAAGGDQHHLVRVLHHHCTDHLAIALRGLALVHALPAPPIPRVYATRDALAAAG